MAHDQQERRKKSPFLYGGFFCWIRRADDELPQKEGRLSDALHSVLEQITPARESGPEKVTEIGFPWWRTARFDHGRGYFAGFVMRRKKG